MATQARPRTGSDAREIVVHPQGGWAPVLSGASVAFVVFLTISSLWIAIAAAGADWMATNLEWFEFATALLAAPVGGVAAGRLSGRGAPGGAWQGLASWGLVLFVGLLIGVPVTGALFSGAANTAVQTMTQASGADAGLAASLDAVNSNLWAAFLIFGGGGLLAAAAGAASSRS